MKPYESYKETNIPWLSEIPSHWDYFRNKNVLIEQKDTVGENSSDYTLLSLTLNGVIKRDMVNAKGKFPKDFDTYKKVSSGDIIFCLFDIDETPRTVGLSSHGGMITGAYDVFSIRDIDSKYLYYYYLSIDNIKAMKPLYTGLRKVIGVPKFLGTKLPVPPREEQGQIVRYLDWKLSKINKLIKAKKKQIELLKEQKQAVINKAVTKGLDDTVPMKESGIEWLGEVPEHWEVNRLKNGCKMINRGVTPQYTEDSSNAMVVNQATFSKGYWDISKVRYTLTNPEQNRGLVWSNDVLIASTGGGVLGKLYHYNEDGVFIADSHVTIVRCNEKLSSKFVYYSFSTKYDLINAILAQGSTNQTELQRDWLVSFYFPFPTIEEQQAIVTYLEEKTALTDKAITVIEKEIELVAEYKTSLISSVVTGKVDVRGIAIPDFEIEDTAEDLDGLEETEDLDELEEE